MCSRECIILHIEDDFKLHKDIILCMYHTLAANPEDRRDFELDPIFVTFQADEQGPEQNERRVLVPLREDQFNEPEELFVIVLTEGSSINSGGLRISRPSSLCRIVDNDGMHK